VIIAGPLFLTFAAKWAPVPVPDLFVTAEDEGEDATQRPRRTLLAGLVSILIPVVLMLASALTDIVWEGSESPAKTVIETGRQPVPSHRSINKFHSQPGTESHRTPITEKPCHRTVLHPPTMINMSLSVRRTAYPTTERVVRWPEPAPSI